MIVGALLGIERLSARKALGVADRHGSASCAALASGLATAPPGAWRGELIMAGAVLCMAFYNVWTRGPSSSARARSASWPSAWAAGGGGARLVGAC